MYYTENLFVSVVGHCEVSLSLRGSVWRDILIARSLAEADARGFTGVIKPRWWLGIFRVDSRGQEIKKKAEKTVTHTSARHMLF